jgi:hypothetical protein
MLGYLTPQERLERIAQLLLRAISLDLQQSDGDEHSTPDAAETEARRGTSVAAPNGREVA